MKIKTIFSVLFLFFLSHNIFAQLHDIGIEFQRYPAGYQFMASAQYALSDMDFIQARVGYNLARRQDFSPYNDEENGGGLGFTVGYRRQLFKEGWQKGFYVGARTDVWFLNIDWVDNDQTPSSGSTDITVLQPTGEIGYIFDLGDSPISLGLNYAAGYEINIVTKGEQVGEGAIGLGGLFILYRF